MSWVPEGSLAGALWHHRMALELDAASDKLDPTSQVASTKSGFEFDWDGCSHKGPQTIYVHNKPSSGAFHTAQEVGAKGRKPAERRGSGLLWFLIAGSFFTKGVDSMLGDRRQFTDPMCLGGGTPEKGRCLMCDRPPGAYSWEKKG
jgi:hypothetical protein